MTVVAYGIIRYELDLAEEMTEDDVTHDAARVEADVQGLFEGQGYARVQIENEPLEFDEV